jgi:plasmid stabilization system protein ParE
VDCKVRITEDALADLADIVEYSILHFPQTAERFGNALLDHIDLLGRFPRLGTPVPHRKGVRKILHSPIRIYYRLHEDRNLVEILHLWHGSRRGPKLK